MTPRRILSVAATAALLLAPPSSLARAAAAPPTAASVPSLSPAVDTALQRAKSRLIEFRRDLHRHPEVSGQEERTARKVADRLRALGLEVRTGVGGHGVVAILKGGKPGPVVAYRADMDAVPSNDPDPVPFHSTVRGVRHACGHDVHTTVAVGIAEALAPSRKDLAGTVVLVFQPAEENVTGARAMIAAGALADPKPGAIFAVHCSPLETGTVGAMEYLVLPGRRLATITLRGDGNVEEAAALWKRIVDQAATVDDRGSAKGAAGTAGSAVSHLEYVHTEIAQESREGTNAATIHAMVKYGSEDAFQRARRALQQGVAQLLTLQVEAHLSFDEEMVPATVNDPALVRRANNVLTAALGEGKVRPVRRAPPQFSEDFSRFQREVPGAMYFLGVSNEKKGIVGVPHSPNFMADEEAIGVGARAMTRVLLNYLESAGASAGVAPASGS
jgi:metal-dependent amidase/aminoacylase/carboxypeptidase family protein